MIALPMLLGSFRLAQAPRPAAEPGPASRPRPAAARTIDERDRVFAFLLALPLELSEEVNGVPIGLATLMGGCAAAFALDALSDGELGAALALSTSGGYPRLATGLLTNAFVHADLLHLLGNMYFLYAFGRLLERRLGTGMILSLFAASTLLASLAFLLAHRGETIELGGASGAVSGILGCYLVLFPTRMVGVSLFFTVLRVPAVLYLGLWFFFQLTSVPLLEQGIAYSAHAGGFMTGVLWGLATRATIAFDGS